MSETLFTIAPFYRVKLQSEGKSESTLRCYLSALDTLAGHQKATGAPTTLSAITRDHIRAFMADQTSRYRPATANNRYRALKTFFKWCLEEELIERSPMDNLKPPSVPEAPPEVMTPDDIKRLLAACKGRAFEDLRDEAIIRLLLDTGMRRSEIGNLGVADVDITTRRAYVVGKGSRPRIVPFGATTANALGRYLLARKRHRATERPRLWLGHSGGMTPDGIYQTVKKRAEQAGLDGVFTHLFRHTFAHMMKASGYSEEDLMSVAGWNSPQMLRRYGKSAAAARAHASYAAHSPLDNL